MASRIRTRLAGNRSTSLLGLVCLTLILALGCGVGSASAQLQSGGGVRALDGGDGYATITGRITDRLTGLPLGNASVSALCLLPDGTWSNDHWPAEVHADGTYIKHVSPNAATAIVIFYEESHVSSLYSGTDFPYYMPSLEQFELWKTGTKVPIAADRETSGINGTLAPREVKVTGTVTAKGSGVPLTGAQVGAYYWDPASSAWKPGALTADGGTKADGSYELDLPVQNSVGDLTSSGLFRTDWRFLVSPPTQDYLHQVWNGHTLPAGFRGAWWEDADMKAALALGETVKVNLADPAHRVDAALERQPVKTKAELLVYSAGYKYGDRVKMEGRLTAVSGVPQPGELTGLQLILDRKKGSATSSDPYREIARGTTNRSGSYVFSTAQAVGIYTYRLRFRGSGRVNAATSSARVVPMSDRLGMPGVFNKTNSLSVTIKGSLRPRHKAGSSTVMLKLSKRYVVKVNGRWTARYKYYKTVATKNRDVSGGSQYYVSLKLPSHGGWKIAWYTTAKSDPGHAPIAVDADDWLR